MEIGAKNSHRMETFANPCDMETKKKKKKKTNVYNAKNEWNLVFQILHSRKHIHSLKKKNPFIFPPSLSMIVCNRHAGT